MFTLLAGVLVACVGTPEAPSLLLAVRPAAACTDPVVGPLRFTDEAVIRGLDFDQDYTSSWGDLDPAGTALVVSDLDGDGDIDLAFGEFPGFPRVYENDGAGVFTRAETGHVSLAPLGTMEEPGVRRGAYHMAADLDGDTLPEMIVYDAGWIGQARNLGGLRWGMLEVLFEVAPGTDPIPQYQTMTVGDADGDGDLDLFAPAVHAAPRAPGPPPFPFREPSFNPYPHQLFENLDGEFVMRDEIVPRAGHPGYCQLASFTDRDGDNDLDLLVASEFGQISGVEPSAFLRNDGGSWPTWVNDAAERGADLKVAAMGLESADLNGDGRLDYCMSDFGAMPCLVSDGVDDYVEGSLALGLHLPPSPDPPGLWWAGYGLDMGDYDADGAMDLSVVAGPAKRSYDNRRNQDMLFFGDGTGIFVDASEETGFADVRRHFALAAADIDGDGWQDLVISGSEGPPVLWMNHCGDGAWIAVDPAGPPGNREGWGARLTVTAGGRTWVEELLSGRAVGQGPARLHVGLGAAERVDELRITWGDGQESVLQDLPVRATVTVAHPQAPEISEP